MSAREMEIKMRLACLFGVLLASPAMAREVLVSTQSEYRAAVEALQPGDTVVLANGEWRDFEIMFTGEGTAEQPITLKAEAKGHVTVTGRSNLRLAGRHLVVSGLVFRDGHSPRSPVIAFRASEDDMAFHSRVTEIAIDGFNKPERLNQDSWVGLYGKHNRLDHSYFAGKSNRGVTIGVHLHDRDGKGRVNIENHHRIDHNYFGPRPVLGSNGGETIRIGNSWNSLSDSLTTVENNYFDRCNGEVEIISNKSGGNVFRGNVFFESRGTLTLRHGNGNTVENNVFLGNRVPHTGGIRVINKDQVVRNNYMYGLTGHRFGGGFVIMNGVYDSPINRYHQVDNALIENNSIIDVDYIELAAGSDEERSAPPINSVFRKNLVYTDGGTDNIRKHDDISGIEFTGNAIHKDVQLEKGDNGLLYPADPAFADTGASRSLNVLSRADVGPTWFPKPGEKDRFGGGETHQVEPGLNTLAAAIDDAGPGDVLELAPGEYIASITISVARPVTIRGNGEAQISSERMALFDIVEGGSLKLDGVTISGEFGPRHPGSTIVRTVPWSIVSNFALVVENSTIQNLNSGPLFSFFDAGKYTFADKIEIRNTSFRDISGTVLKMNREVDDRGIYNGEYITVTDSQFENIGGAIADIYRCCTDESTFGPHFAMTGSLVASVGIDEENPTGASIRLLGAQVVNIDDNDFSDSKPVLITETVGEPVTTLGDNRFADTLEPEIQFFGGK